MISTFLDTLISWLKRAYENLQIYRPPQARSQKNFLGSALEEKVNLLILYHSPGAVREFTIAWCMLIAHTHEGLNNHRRVIVLAVARRTFSKVCGLVTPCICSLQ